MNEELHNTNLKQNDSLVILSQKYEKLENKHQLMATELKQTRDKFLTLTKFIHKKGGVSVLNALPNDPNF